MFRARWKSTDISAVDWSNGAPFNEHVYGGVVSIGQGALKMLSVIAGDGDMKGRETYQLNEHFNWIIHTDLALNDPKGW